MPDSPPENKQPREENLWRLIGRYSNLAFVLPAAIILRLIIGHLLDRWLGKSWITLAGLFVGCIAGFAELIRGIIPSSKDSWPLHLRILLPIKNPIPRYWTRRLS